MLTYTICFVRVRHYLLLLHRAKEPHKGLLNGVGGKIKPGETPYQCICREVEEETGIRPHAGSLRFAGIVTWNAGADVDPQSTGMYAYVVRLPNDTLMQTYARGTREGRLDWYDLSWACRPTNTEVVNNIQFYLPDMLGGTPPVQWALTYNSGFLSHIIRRPLPAALPAGVTG